MLVDMSVAARERQVLGLTTCVRGRGKLHFAGLVL